MSAADLLMTRHAERRAIDRSIPEVARWLLLEFTTPKRAGKAAVTYSFDRKAWRKVERFLGTWGAETVGTDIDGHKKIFRARAWIAEFFRINNASAGDIAFIKETGPYRYRMTLRKAI